MKKLLVVGLMSLGLMLGCGGSKKEGPVVPETCATSAGCKEDGQCTDENGICVVGSQADCQQSKKCKTQGWCAVTTVGGVRACKP